MNVATQFTRFSLVGVCAAVGHYGTLIVLAELAGVAAVPASLAGFTVGAIVSYALNYRYTFRSTKHHGEALTKFLTVAAVGFIVNGLVMAALTGPAQIHYLAAQIIATGTVLVWTFLCNRYWTFRERQPR